MVLFMKQDFKLRVLMSLLGVTVCGFSVGIFRTAELGVDPFQSFMSGMEAVIPISFGTLYVIVNAVLLIFSLIFDRRQIGLATIINLTLLGYVAEFSEKLLRSLFPGPSLAGRVLLLAVALVLLCFSSALYFNADLGVSTYDAVSRVAAKRQNRIPFRWCRIISDVICVCVAALLLRLGGKTWSGVTAFIGPATIITAFFMGPLISFFSNKLPSFQK